MFDLAGGKTEWLAAGLPTEGESPPPAGAGAVARAAPTCRASDEIDAVAERADVVEFGLCVVVNEAGVVLGRLREKELAQRGRRVDEVMEPGPTTVRFDEELTGLIERMQSRKVGSILVTAASGRLIGVLQRSDGEELIHKLHHEHQHHHEHGG